MLVLYIETNLGSKYMNSFLKLDQFNLVSLNLQTLCQNKFRIIILFLCSDNYLYNVYHIMHFLFSKLIALPQMYTITMRK